RRLASLHGVRRAPASRGGARSGAPARGSDRSASAPRADGMSFEEPRFPMRAVLMTGVIGAVASALLGMFAPHDGAVWRAPRVLEQRVETALMASGRSGLEVAMN